MRFDEFDQGSGVPNVRIVPLTSSESSIWEISMDPFPI